MTNTITVIENTEYEIVSVIEQTIEVSDATNQPIDVDVLGDQSFAITLDSAGQPINISIAGDLGMILKLTDAINNAEANTLANAAIAEAAADEAVAAQADVGSNAAIAVAAKDLAVAAKDEAQAAAVSANESKLTTSGYVAETENNRIQSAASATAAAASATQTSSDVAAIGTAASDAEAAALSATNSESASAASEAVAVSKAAEASASAASALANKNATDTNAATTTGHAATTTTNAATATTKASEALASATSASASELLASRYAAHPVDTLIPSTADYSALHWASEAADSAASVAGVIIWMGQWDAAVNGTPPTPSQPVRYIIISAGTVDGKAVLVDDQIIYDTIGATWLVQAGSSAVASVNGQVGAVVLDYSNFAGASAISLTNGTSLQGKNTSGVDHSLLYRDGGNRSVLGTTTYDTRIYSLTTPEWYDGTTVRDLIHVGGGQTISGNLTATTFVGALSGNASTASSAAVLSTPRTINGVSFNGSSNITVADSTKLPLTGGTLTGSLTGTSIIASTFTGALSGNATTATTLATARTIGLSGITATATAFNGGSNITIPVTAVPVSLLTGTIGDSLLSGSYTGLTNLTGSGIADFGKFMGNAADSVSAPSFSFTGDTDTGMYSPAANQIGITTGGVQRLLVNSSGVTAATFIGALSGNATTATSATTAGSAATLSTPRTINGVSFNGSANITVADSTKLPLTGGTVSGALTVAGACNLNGGLIQDGHTILNGSDSWLRTNGSDGWYSATHGGGWHMTDTSYVRTYNSKGIFAEGGSVINGAIDAKAGINGSYGNQNGSGNNWGANIWSIGNAYDGSGLGTSYSVAGSFGISWLRSTHTSANGVIGEGIYLYQAGALAGGMGTQGIYTGGDIWADGSVIEAGQSLSARYAPLSHNHSATSITSGTMDKARLPAANNSASAGSGFGGFRYTVSGNTLNLYTT